MHCDILLKCLAKLLPLLSKGLPSSRHDWLLLLFFLTMVYLFLNDIVKLITKLATEFVTLPIFILIEVVIIVIYCAVRGAR